MSESKTVLIIDDEPGMRDVISRMFADIGCDTATAPDGASGLALAEQGEFDLVILDMSLPKMSGLNVLNGIKEDKPDLPVIMVTAYGSTQTAIEAMRLGAYDYITKPFELDELQMLAERAFEQSRVIDENHFLRGELRKKYGFDNIIGSNNDVQSAYVMAAQVAKSNATVLVLGETGTGKEYLARAIHYQSDRADGPFIKVNCAALPENLLESELFGHEKGAFTNAIARHIGRFEVANRGTILLDEIGEISPSVQTKLLRVLQEKQFERVGGSETLTVDVRVIAATNRNLEEAIDNNEFRDDLLYRLNVIQIELPPIRERGEDVLLFARHFLDIYADETGKRVKIFSDDAIAELQSHSWPGNIRELENAIERAVILCNGETIRPEHLRLRPYQQSRQAKAQDSLQDSYPLTASLRDMEKIHIERVLKDRNWNQSSTAESLGIDRKTLRNKIREFGLEKPA
ncbi:MAG: sigma-54-dependent Fis family transcriptional regulator [Armatimonadetes bacterium]|nr:sigma-54-dependent Fis family transcriptional regulator [Armatimonadota bacterium]